MARLYADEDFSDRVVDVLRHLGHDVLTARDAGVANRKIDDDVALAFALADRRVVMTHNRRHYIRLHRRGHAHAGIIACTRDPDPGALAARIDAALSNSGALDGQLIRIIRPHRP